MKQSFRQPASRHAITDCGHLFPQRRTYLTLLMVLAALSFLLSSSFSSRRADAQDVRARFEQDMRRVFTAREELSIDPRAIGEQLRSTGRISLVTRVHNFELALRPNDLRAANYHAEEVGPDGTTHPITMSAVTTYKGNIEGVWGSDARFTVNDNDVEGMIVTPTESYFLESARKYSSAAQPTDYVLYKGSDVRPDILRTCGTTLDEKINAGAIQFMSSATTGVAPAVFSPLKVVEIATEADLEYTTALGGSAQANNDILSILNQIQAIYERDIGLTFSVTFQHTWTVADPFSANGPGAVAILNAFTNHWNANFTGTTRDVAHLWSGKNLGGPNGLAWTGVVCLDGAHAYGISDLETMSPFRVTIPAHEIGHNFNAGHCDGQIGCDNTIMVATQGPANTSTFCAFSVNEITTFVTANSSCLSNKVGGGTTVAFNAANFPVGEGAGFMNVTVTRAGDTSGASSVAYATSNGTGKEGKDYVAAIGVVNFAAGETSKTFQVLVIDNAYVDGSRTVNLTLSGPTGATLAAQSAATLTISDNDAMVGANPLDTPRSFVQLDYYDFLGRYPDTGGWDFWTNQITNCGMNGQCIEVARINVSASFFLSIEFQQTGYLVERFYKVGYGDATGNSTFNGAHQLPVPIIRFDEFLRDSERIRRGVVVLAPGWEALLEANKVAYSNEFVQTARFTTAFPTNLTPTAFVNQLDQRAGFPLLAGDRTTLINMFSGAGDTTNTTVRAQVVRQVAENSTLNTAEFNRAFVLAQYFGYLRRNPNDAPDGDYTGYDFWLTKLNQFNGNYINAEMVKAFLSSIEYRQRFGTP